MTNDTNLPSLKSFDALVSSIQTVSDQITAHAAKAVNVGLTVRNWMIGYTTSPSTS